MMYFSAMKAWNRFNVDLESISDIPEGTTYKENKIILIRHDVTNPLPKEFEECDVFYIESAWPHGLKVFNERAHKEVRFDDYVKALHGIAERGVPTFIVAGKTAGKILSDASFNTMISLRGETEVNLYSYNITTPVYAKTTFDLLDYLATKYECVGDPCCGLGLTGRVFLKHGKKAVISDYNGRCINYLWHTKKFY